MADVSRSGVSPRHNSWDLCRRLWREDIRRYWRKLLIAQIAIVIVGVATFAQVRLLEPIFDFILVEGRKEFLYLLPLLFFVLSVVRGSALYLQNRMIAWVGHRVVQNIQNRLYARLITGDVSRMMRNQTGALMSRFTFDMQLVRTVVAKSMIGAIRDFFFLLVYFANLVYTNWQLAVMIGFIFPLAVLPIVIVGRILRKISHHLQEQTGIASTFLDESFRGITQIKAYGSENFMLARAGEIFRFLFQVNFRQEDVRARMHPVIESLFGLAMALTILMSGYQIIQGTTTVGAFMSFFTALMLAYQPIRSLSNVNAGLQEGLAAADRLFVMIDDTPKIRNRASAKSLKVKKGEITIDKVSFAYDDGAQHALHEIDFRIQGGQKVALVGPSGSGKSTLFNLILRFYDPSAGRIAIDGQDIKNVSMDSLRRHIAVVSQEQGLFNDSIIANIAFGDETIDIDRVHQAAKLADADGFIKRLPERYHTPVGQSGNRLSGGQKQRLAIARAIYKDAPILLLDEATSSLDTRSEKKITEALKRLMRNRTTLIIAHRLSMVRDADMIYVLNHGRIQEFGTHQSLLAQKGLYALLHDTGSELR